MTDTADSDAGSDEGAAPAEEPDAQAATAEAPDELVARIAALDEAAAAEVEALADRVETLETDLEERAADLDAAEETVEELESKLKRARADFQNYKKRAKAREAEIKERATEDLIERLLDVRDNLVRALQQDDDVEIRDGVEATLSTFDRVLDAENVSAIEPDVGADVDPERHEVVHRTASDLPEGAIAEVYRPGYAMAGAILRPAQVTVSEGADAETPDAEDED